ncbi:MAG: ABC transporter permease [Leptolyngbyaceae bacterium]|nr:ABC transporter permease [Leptolyngbyaceae bacterium]
MNPNRIRAISTNVFREVVRDQVLYLIGFYALIMAAAIRLLPEVAASTEKKMLIDVGLAAIEILGLVIAAFVGTGLVNKEIEKRTVLILMAKPITPAEFVLGKHLGLSAVLAVLVAAMTVVFLAVLQLSQTSYFLGSTLVIILYLFLKLSLVTAAAILFGVFTSSILATLMTFAVYFIGIFSRDFVKLGLASLNPEVKQLTEMLYLAVPDLARLDLKNGDALYGVLPSPLELLTNAGYGVIYAILFLSIATFIFSRRQF